MEYGAVAQLGERYNGIVEVRGSIPLGSTIPPIYDTSEFLLLHSGIISLSGVERPLVLFSPVVLFPAAGRRPPQGQGKQEAVAVESGERAARYFFNPISRRRSCRYSSAVIGTG